MSTPRPKLLTRQEIVAALAVHKRTVYAWMQEGMPVAKKTPAGPVFSLHEVREWLRAREAKRSAFTEARARKERAQAMLAAQTVAMRARELVPRREVEKEWSRKISAARSVILSWPLMLSDQLQRAATIGGARAMEKVLRVAVHDALRELEG